MSYLETKNGIRWHYTIEGKGASLLFLHGWGVDSRIWRQQIKFFSQKYQVLVIDLPGHGKSHWKKMGTKEMAGNLDEILEYLNIKRVVIVGSSMGGMLALRYYELFPHKVLRLTFVGSMPKFPQSQDYPYGLELKQMRKLRRQLETDYPAIVNIFFRSLFTKEERQSRRFIWLQKFRRADKVPAKQSLIEYLDLLEQEDLRDVLKKAEIPVQFISGREDYICNKNIIYFLKQQLPSARFDHFEGCGHFPFLSRPHEFNKVLDEFLNQKF